MRLSEKLDHTLRQYSYKRKRGSSRSKNRSNLNVEEYLAGVDSYLDEIIQEIDEFLPKKGCK